MVKDGKYRYTLQFGMDTEAEQRAGKFLERLGNRKSPFIVYAINECLDNHPDLCDDQSKVQLTVSGVDPRMLESKIRQVVEEYLGAAPIPKHAVNCTIESTEKVSNDILDMLSDLDMFK